MNIAAPTVSVDEFFQMSGPVLDVRSPAEYRHSRIPGASSFPLFSDEERREVGICYKTLGQQEAIRLGVKLVGPKLSHFLELIEKKSSTTPYRIYCWRGGLRSSFVGWFFTFSGFPSVTLQGGYKAFRRHALKLFEKKWRFIVLGGSTGSGKTEFLQQLSERGEQVIDLEAIAHHRGSAFGRTGVELSNEQFENELASILNEMDNTHPIWIEDESRLIGSSVIPGSLFEQMGQSPLLCINVSKEERIARIVALYGKEEIQTLVQATKYIERKLGTEKTKQVISLIEESKFAEATDLLLDYYDKTYAYAMKRRKGQIITLDAPDIDAFLLAARSCK